MRPDVLARQWSDPDRHGRWVGDSRRSLRPTHHVGMRSGTTSQTLVLAALAVVSIGPTALRAQSPQPGAAPDAHVLVLTTGGTIASRASGQMSGDRLVAAVPQLADHARITVEEFSRIGSSQMTPDHWLRLAKRVNAAFRADPGLTGIVITHGTDTMDETAFFLNLTVKDDRPVVVVGSMRTPSEISPDGPANLLNAVRVATSPDAVGKGVLVVLNEDIASARDVWKTHNRRVETFRSPELGFLGFVDPDAVVFYRSSLRPHTTATEFDVEELQALRTVAVASDQTGSDGSILAFLATQAPDGVILETFAGGRISPGTRAGAATVIEAGIPLVLASRVPGGRIVGDVTGDSGTLVARDLSPHKARILLMLALGVTRDPTELQRILDTY